MILKIQNIIPQIQAVFVDGKEDEFIDSISIDSRSLQNGPHTLFFALVGPNHDAHSYVKDLIGKGVQNFVVTHVPEDCEKQANFLIVENTVVALQAFAAYYRGLFGFPIIGLTGSNGKTIVKEWLNFLLSPDYNIIRSPKSYNSQVGVPLSVTAINEHHNLGIFEAGISTTSEMEKLQKIIRPSIGILTNIGTAHDEGFADLEEKIKEKMLLFQESEIVIFQKNELVDSCVSADSKAFSWSFSNKEAAVFISKKQKVDQNTLICYHYKGNSFEMKIPFQDDASIENAISCLMVTVFRIR
jgi:alanine racemase